MFRRPHYIAISAVVLVVLVVLNLPNQTTAQFKLLLGGLFLPLFGIVHTTQVVSEKASDAALPRPVLIAEVERLRRENEELKLRTMQSTQLWEENAQLRSALAWTEQSPWNLKPARVVARDPSNWWRTIQIDRGERDGLAINLPVVTPEGLVGKVSQVGFASAQILLLGDPNCQLDAQIEKSAHGILRSASSGVLDPSVVKLEFIDSQIKVHAGQKVLTSGRGGVFPKGLFIGHVLDSHTVDYGMYQEARVKLAADLKKLDFVFVLLP